jgi:hypothetical protein
METYVRIFIKNGKKLSAQEGCLVGAALCSVLAVNLDNNLLDFHLADTINFLNISVNVKTMRQLFRNCSSYLWFTAKVLVAVGASLTLLPMLEDSRITPMTPAVTAVTAVPDRTWGQFIVGKGWLW